MLYTIAHLQHALVERNSEFGTRASVGAVYDRAFFRSLTTARGHRPRLQWYQSHCYALLDRTAKEFSEEHLEVRYEEQGWGSGLRIFSHLNAVNPSHICASRKCRVRQQDRHRQGHCHGVAMDQSPYLPEVRW